jgi:hypothetical protein
MPTLNIGGQPALTFYDSEANAHFSDGEMAEAAGFRVIDPTGTQISVVGGGQVYTAYGHYRSILRPANSAGISLRESPYMFDVSLCPTGG